jgi:hypothetical protein
MGIKKTESDADLESVEKVAKKLQMESLRAENFCTQYYCIVNGKKVRNFFLF